MALFAMAFLSLGCARGQPVIDDEKLWVEELSVPDSNLFAIAGNAQGGVYAGARGIYKRDNGQWRLIEGTSGRVWRALSVVGDHDVWAAGRGATVLHWDGQTATEMLVPGVGTDLHHIAAFQDVVWVSSTAEQIWRWDGSGWNAVKPPEVAGRYMAGIYASAPDRLFVHTPLLSTGKPTGIARYDGKSWVVDVLGKRWTFVGSLDGSGPNDVWAVGMKHAGLFGNTGFSYHWDGKGWTDVPLPLEEHISAVSVRSPTDAWAAGWHSTLLHWNGKAWKTMSTGGKQTFTRIFAAPDGTVYVVENDQRLLRWAGEVP